MKKKDADCIFEERSLIKPGKWVRHSALAAHAAETIARECGLDSEEAYCMGLLHDIGRSLTDGQFLHITCGYQYMKKLGRDDIARICLTHSFPLQDIHTYMGVYDVSKEELEHYSGLLSGIVYDDYDRLIQLCDALSGTEHYVTIEERSQGLVRKYGEKPFMEERLRKLSETERHFEDLGYDPGSLTGLPEKLSSMSSSRERTPGECQGTPQE